MMWKTTSLLLLVLGMFATTLLVGAELQPRSCQMCLNETWRAQFMTIDANDNPVPTTLLGEYTELGTTIDDANNIVTFSPQATGDYYIEVSLKPIDDRCWDPPRRVFAWEITVNPTMGWEVEVVESVE